MLLVETKLLRLRYASQILTLRVANYREGAACAMATQIIISNRTHHLLYYIENILKFILFFKRSMKTFVFVHVGVFYHHSYIYDIFLASWANSI